MTMRIPKSRPNITFISDFGLQDEYTGVVKGVIIGHSPEARIIDISHLIPPQSIRTAAHLLDRSYRYFPGGTVHLVIVDPCVGSNRAILAVCADGQFFIGPDNGLFFPLLHKAANLAVFRVDISSIEQKNVSATFHGRDIMAPIAAHLANGRDISEYGVPILPEDCLWLEEISCRVHKNSLQGTVIHIDVFGNLCTNIRRKDIEDFASGDELLIHVADTSLVALDRNYAAHCPGTTLALFDSHDYLEIAVNQGNAAKQLQLDIGAEIILSRRKKKQSRT